MRWFPRSRQWEGKRQINCLAILGICLAAATSKRSKRSYFSSFFIILCSTSDFFLGRLLRYFSGMSQHRHEARKTSTNTRSLSSCPLKATVAGGGFVGCFPPCTLIDCRFVFIVVCTWSESVVVRQRRSLACHRRVVFPSPFVSRGWRII